MPTQRHEEKKGRTHESVGAGERDPWPFGSSFYKFFPPPGPALCKLGQPGVLFVLPEGLTPVGPSFVLFSWAFPFLVFQPPPFWTPVSYSNYLTESSIGAGQGWGTHSKQVPLTGHSVQFSSVQSLSFARLFATPWTAAQQASLSITNSQSTQTHVH